MITNKQYAYISGLSLLLGIFIFAIHKEYIIFNFASKRITPADSSITQKKNVALHYWHHNQWNTDQIFLLVSDNRSNTLQQLINQWLQLVHDEKIIKKKAIVQTAVLGYDQQELFLSLDRAPWNKESSTFDKWMLIEGILKTIKNNDATIKKVRFLINHQPINDPHLDFTNSWPIEGFLTLS